MEVFEAIASRRSIRKYRSDSVPPEQIEKLLEAARLAPSTSNTQSWKFKVVTDDSTREQLARAANNQKFVAQAPVLIACCLDFGAFRERGKQVRKLILSGAVKPSMEMILHYVRGGEEDAYKGERVVINGTINVAIASEHMVLEAASLGLGTCWVRAFDPNEVQEILGVPDDVSVLSLLTVGYPDQSPPPRPRKTLDEIRL
jgi:nitroreductase